jgi:hypothetical protein
VATKHHLKEWIIEALKELGGSAALVDVCRAVWRRHQPELRSSGDLFYTWQYDIRWAAQELRNEGRLRPMGKSRRGPWTLT